MVFFNHLQSRELTTSGIGGDTTSRQSKYSALQHVVQLNYGLPFDLRIGLNVGLDFFYAHVRSDQEVTGSFWRVVGNNDQTGVSIRALHSVGPRIRVAPIPQLPDLSFQTSIRVPVVQGQERRQALGADRVVWQTQAIFYQHFLYRMTWQFQAAYSRFFQNKARLQTHHAFSYASYVVYRFYQEKLYALGSISYGEERMKTLKNGLQRTGYDTSVGGGLYWQVDRRVSFVATAEVPVRYEIGSLSTTVNKGSWWKANVGVRYGLTNRQPIGSP